VGRSVGVLTEHLMEGAEGRVYCQFKGFNYAAYRVDSGDLGGQWQIVMESSDFIT